jgi:hypothetical protein
MALTQADKEYIEELIADTIAAKRRPSSGTMTGPQIITAIGADGISNTEIASVTDTIKGDIGAGLDDLTPAEVRTLINVVNGSRPGGKRYGTPIVGQLYALTDSVASIALGSSTAAIAGALDLVPYTPQVTWTPAALGAAVITGDGVAQIKILVYSSSANDHPDAKLYESAALAAGAAVTNSYVSANTSMPTFTAGVTYWVGVLSDGVPTMRTLSVTGTASINHVLTTITGSQPVHKIRRTGLTFATPIDPWAFATSQYSISVAPTLVVATA